MYAQARYYLPEVGRFISEDAYWGKVSGPQSLNLYAYCTNNPIHRIDPSGNESYIFYTTAKGSDFTEQAKWQNNRLEGMGERVIMVPVSSVVDFVNGWNGMGKVNGEPVDINTIAIYSHGNQRCLILESGSSTNAISINGENSAGEEIRNINTLESKEIRELNLLSCNGGHLLTYYQEGENLGSVLSQKVVNGNVYAYDGNVSFGKPIWDICGEDIGRSSRLSTNQQGFNKINKRYNVNNREPRGKITYYNGEYKPFGYWPRTSIRAAS
jgi:hypothetical protein